MGNAKLVSSTDQASVQRAIVMPSRGLGDSIYRRFAGTNVAANTEFSESVPAGKTWLVLCFSISCVQGITQTPQPILIIDDGTTLLYESLGSSAAQAVSTTCQYNWGPGLTISGQIGATTNVHSFAPLPAGLLLPAGYRLRSSTIGIGANTDYAAPSIYVIEYSAV